MMSSCDLLPCRNASSTVVRDECSRHCSGICNVTSANTAHCHHTNGLDPLR